MKQPKPTTALCLVGLLLVLCVSYLEAGGRHRHRSHRKSHRDTGVHIEIYHPKGLMVWYPQRRGMISFGIEIFLNQKHQIDDEAVCDICLNTTEVTYGKFILRSDDAIIRGGDHLMYNAIKQKVNGTAYTMRSNEFYVADSRIISQKTSSRPTPSGDQQNTVASLEEEINVLENVVYNVFQHCNNVTRTSKNLYLNFRPAETRLDSKALYAYTLNVLQEMLPKINWETVLINTFYYEDGVAFEVKTLIDKLKVLQMSRNFTQFTVSDLDDLEGTPEDNEIELYEE